MDLLREIASEDIEALAESYPNERALYLSFEDIRETRPQLAHGLRERPATVLERLEDALAEYPVEADVRALTRATVRIHDLPEEATYTPGLQNPSDAIYRLVELEGQITKRTDVRPQIHRAAFECSACRNEEWVEQPLFGNLRDPPWSCDCDRPAKFKSWRLTEERSEWRDYQKLRLQQPPEDALDGETAYLDVHVVGDLAGERAIRAGARVSVTGRYFPVRTKDLVTHEKHVEGYSVVSTDESVDDLEAEYADTIADLRAADDSVRRLVESVAPDVEGYPHIKKALVLQLFGDFERWGRDGQQHRGASHMYLLGDPGTGKTVLLESAAKRAPKAAKTDGTGSSAAGLTAAIVKDSFSDEQFSIQAGTLVRANDGLAVVDELDKGDTSDLEALHTALESQEVRIEKAGRAATLPAKTALLAAGNPTGGHFDPTREIADQVDLQSPLLSRFDLIFVVREEIDRERLETISETMVESRDRAGRYTRGDDVDASASERALSADAFAAAVAAGRQLQPVAASEAVLEAFSEWFVDQKMSLPNRYREAVDEGGEYDGPPLPITARKLDAVQRLAAAHARARFSEQITLADVRAVTPLIERSLADIGIAPADNKAFGQAAADTSEVGL